MAGEFLRSFANVLLQLESERSGLIFGQRFLREESVSVSEKRNCSPTPLVNLRWTQLSENFLLIRKDPSAISEKRQPLEKNFPFKLEICYEERLEILQEEICNFEESFLLLEPSQTLRYFLQRYEKNFSNILNLVLFQTLRILENRNTCSKNPTEKIPSEKSDALTSRFVETPIFAVEKSAGI